MPQSGWKNGYWELFKCPLCGSSKYVEVRVQRPSGHWYTTAFYQCFSCSVMFRDPVLFSKCMVSTANDECTPAGAYIVRPDMMRKQDSD
jgi:hypothetical protein